MSIVYDTFDLERTGNMQYVSICPEKHNKNVVVDNVNPNKHWRSHRYLFYSSGAFTAQKYLDEIL